MLVAGGGPAGSAAALAALAEGAAVRIYEKSSFPRHKVCGEFLSPEIQPELESLGVWSDFLDARPSLIRAIRLRFGRSAKQWRLDAPAFGLSRYRLDQLLLNCAVARGAELSHESFPEAQAPGARPAILAYGRTASAHKGERLFGFKAHFDGPADDTVEMFFDARAYAGVSCVEDGITNVCGVAPESQLAAKGFDADQFIQTWAPLRERTGPLTRVTDWLITGPLVFARESTPGREDHYRAGDALGFVDPFTGSGILAGVATGSLAGRSAARAVPVQEYLDQCARLLRFQYWISSLARFALMKGLAEDFMKWLPGEFLFRLTRPKVALK